MRVLITGARGFIGVNLTEELEASHYEVIGVDREDGDLTEPGVFEGHVHRHHPDLVVHLAAQVGRLKGEDDLIHTVQSNAQMTTLVAACCGRKQIDLLYTSTSEVYGDQGKHLCQEYDTLALPHNLYGLSKRWGEEAVRLYHPDAKIVRLSMPYGAGAPPGRGRRALDNFLWNAQHERPITVHRGAERSWCHVSDTVDGMRRVIEQAPPGTIFNVGRDDVPVSMLDLARMCCEVVGAPESLIEEVDPPSAQTVVKRLSTQRLRNLGWEPKVRLEMGVRELNEWIGQFDADGQHVGA